MNGAFISFLIAIFFVAVVTRDSYAFIIFYLFAGAFLLSRWWVSRTSSAIRITRKFERHAFPGEKIPVELLIVSPAVSLAARPGIISPGNREYQNPQAGIQSCAPHE
jgi:uncharacterized protein (DUF58 family)